MIAWVVKTGQKGFEKVWVVMRGQRGYVNVHFCPSHFFWLFLFAPDFARPIAECVSVFHMNPVPTFNIKKYIDFDQNKIIKAHRGKKKTIIIIIAWYVYHS